MKYLPILLLFYALPTDSAQTHLTWQNFGKYEFGAPCSDLHNAEDWREVIGADGVIRKECNEIVLKRLGKRP
jgi:hypothetical protein